MELALNLCWCALVVFVALSARLRESRVGPDRAVLALVCAALLIFPAISISDDLHISDSPFEESSTRTVKAVPALRLMQAVQALVPSIVAPEPRMRSYEMQSEAITPFIESPFLRPLTGRDPPLQRV